MNFLKKIKFIFFDFLSFGSPQAIVFNLSVILIILALLPTGDLGYLPIKPVFKEFLLPLIFGGNCPDSGILKNCDVYSTGQTRGISNLLHGNFQEAWEFNKITPFLFLVMIILIIKIMFIYPVLQ